MKATWAMTSTISITHLCHHLVYIFSRLAKTLYYNKLFCIPMDLLKKIIKLLQIMMNISEDHHQIHIDISYCCIITSTN